MARGLKKVLRAGSRFRNKSIVASQARSVVIAIFAEHSTLF